MKYSNGHEVHVGDRVRLRGDDGGIVVCSIDTGEYSKDYPEEHWSYLKRGVMIKFPKYGLIHIEEDDSDLKLVNRANYKWL